MTRRMKKDLGQLLWGVGFAAAAGTVLYLATGKGEKNSPFIPDALEDQIDAAVDALNRRFGRVWVDHGLAALDEALRAALPSAIVGLLDAIVAVEQQTRQLRVAGQTVTSVQKRAMAVQKLASPAH